MKVFELEYLLKDLPNDANLDVLHVTKSGRMCAYSVVNVSEDQLGGHLIVASKRQLADSTRAISGHLDAHEDAK